jgi:hypothetical protein
MFARPILIDIPTLEHTPSTATHEPHRPRRRSRPRPRVWSTFASESSYVPTPTAPRARRPVRFLRRQPRPPRTPICVYQRSSAVVSVASGPFGSIRGCALFAAITQGVLVYRDWATLEIFWAHEVTKALNFSVSFGLSFPPNFADSVSNSADFDCSTCIFELSPAFIAL